MSVSIAQGVVAVAPKQIVAGTNITTSETDTTITINSTGGGGGGGSVNSGSVAIDFGATPGTNFVSVDVTGQAAITGTSKVKAYKAIQATATHNEYEHIVVPLNLSVGNIVAGTGFTVYATTDLRLDGTFNINWEWV